METKPNAAASQSASPTHAANPIGKSSEKPSAFDNPNAHLMKSFTSKKEEPSAVKVLLVLVLMAGLGIGTGYGVSLLTAPKASDSALSEETATTMSPEDPKKGETYGAGDTSVFKDTAQGTLKEGGIENEGQYHLERPGGESQNVYMTSSSVDLSKFVDMKIKVWGQTQTAQHAGWLMDVGKVEVL